MVIRNEKDADRETVEEITRRAFYNLYIPGCVEHYLVHIMREHEDFIPELDLVAELDGQVIGNIMFTKARLVDEQGREKNILAIDEQAAQEYDGGLEPMEKKHLFSQEEFYIMSHSFVEDARN